MKFNFNIDRIFYSVSDFKRIISLNHKNKHINDNTFAIKSNLIEDLTEYKIIL